MELDEHAFLDELLALRRDAWDDGLPGGGIDDFFSGGDSNFDCFRENPAAALVPPGFAGYEGVNVSFDCLSEVYGAVAPGFTVPVPEFQASAAAMGSVPVLEDDGRSVCKVEAASGGDVIQGVLGGGGARGERKKRKVEGMPSKNLMAERRRRKRLNDRLSMLRSVVPKISKMDRTSILGDTIDYMKELLERIKHLREEIEEGSEQSNLLNIFKELNPNEILVRNSPKFDVERRNTDTRIEICCSAKPGLLLSTVNTLEALGLEIQQCVVSCFNDFGMQASCSEDMEQRAVVSDEEIKQALFRNAGYGGRCM